MTAALFPWRFAHLTELAKQAECHETPSWAVESILDVEILTPQVLDPCCGRGVLAEEATRQGYSVRSIDLHDWGYGDDRGVDFLTFNPEMPPGFTVLMNPPFSKAVEFVERALDLKARKVVCFQRFAWWESVERTDFWDRHRPSRIYVCRSRATCWRIDIPPEERKSSSPTAHAWFVWEKGHPPAAAMGHIDRRAT